MSARSESPKVAGLGTRTRQPLGAAPRQPYVAHLGLVVLLCMVALSLPRTPVLPEALSVAVPAVAREPLQVVNKSRPLEPASYAPPELIAAAGTALVPTAATALAEMINAAARDGVHVVAVSGYRSFDTQTRLYAGYTSRLGQAHTDELSARPGFSEHQTGLAVDIGNPDARCALQRCFADTPAGSWAAANSARFGFIIRYPEGASAVTGYDYEPWHLRYVGPESAAAIVQGGLTLEAYEGLPAAPSY